MPRRRLQIGYDLACLHQRRRNSSSLATTNRYFLMGIQPVLHEKRQRFAALRDVTAVDEEFLAVRADIERSIVALSLWPETAHAELRGQLHCRIPSGRRR